MPTKDKLKFTWLEFSGSLGDLGLFIPLVVAMTIACGLDFGIILICAGIMNIASGWFFRKPIPVQPMKAIAAVVITEGLGKDELIAAGILMGVLLLVISFGINHIARFIPKSIVRGIQLGIGIKLALQGVLWINELPVLGLNSICVAIIVMGILIFTMDRKQPILVFLFLTGLILVYFEHPNSYASFNIALPKFQLLLPASTSWSGGFFNGALPQLPLTILNSVVALCALSADYFPGKKLSMRKIAASIGLMNLFCVPICGIPMCHGAGGLAAQYRFGARSGGSVIMLGVLKIIIGVLFSGTLLILLIKYPVSILGPMLIFAGIELAKISKDSFGSTKDTITMLITAIVILGINAFVGFIAGISVSIIFRMQSWRLK